MNTLAVLLTLGRFGQRSWLFVTGFGGLFFVLSNSLEAQDPASAPSLPKLEATFYQDFRNKDSLGANFRKTGTDAANQVRLEPEGLRVTLPVTQSQVVGVTANFKVKGDFEITAGYELIQVDPPKGGFGTGFEIYLQTQETGNALGFNRITGRGGNDEYYSGRAKTNMEGKRQWTTGKFLPAKGKTGFLRITRIGPEVVLSAAEAPGTEFRELYRYDLGSDTISQLRLAAHPGGAANPVDLRVLDLTVRSAAPLLLPNLADNNKGATKSGKPKTSKAEPSTASSANAPMEFYEDFRNKTLEELKCKPVAFDLAKFMKCEPEGLRITLTPDQGKHRETGVAPPLIIQGDFEITAGYEIIEAQEGRRTTFEIYLATKSATGEALGFHRYIDSGAQFFGSRMTTNAQGKRENVQGLDLGSSPYRAGAKSGHLRITRLGTEAILSFADPGQEFKEQFRVPLGSEEVSKLRIGVNPRNATIADVRLTDLRIRGNLTATVKAVPVRGNWLWLVIAIFTTLFVVAGAWLLVRRVRSKTLAGDSPPTDAIADIEDPK